MPHTKQFYVAFLCCLRRCEELIDTELYMRSRNLSKPGDYVSDYVQAALDCLGIEIPKRKRKKRIVEAE